MTPGFKDSHSVKMPVANEHIDHDVAMSVLFEAGQKHDGFVKNVGVVNENPQTLDVLWENEADFDLGGDSVFVSMPKISAPTEFATQIAAL